MYKQADRLVVDEWGTLAFILLFVTNSVSRFVANLRIGRINSNLKKQTCFFYAAVICELGNLLSNFK